MISIIFLIIFQLNSQANTLISFFPYCSLKRLDVAIVESQRYLVTDKEYHCAVSCILALSCPSEEVLWVGIYKELRDIVLPGDAEFADLQADWKGIRLVLTGSAQNKRNCINLCAIN